jgi:hypothetical protein
MKIPLDQPQEKLSFPIKNAIVESIKDLLRNKAVADNSDVNFSSTQSNPKLSQPSEAQVCMIN